MKGAIFIALNEMVEEVAGIQAWNDALEVVNPESGGIYTSVDTYADEELFALAGALSKNLDIPLPDLIKAFGERLFDFLNDRYPQYLEAADSFLDFLSSINDSIHKEVKILYPQAYLPRLDCKKLSENELLMNYASKRKLCSLAEGLISGAAKHYNKKYDFVHYQCMHDGHDHCEFLITLKD